MSSKIILRLFSSTRPIFSYRYFPYLLVVRYTDLSDILLIKREKVLEEEGRRYPSLDRPLLYQDILLPLYNTSFY